MLLDQRDGAFRPNATIRVSLAGCRAERITEGLDRQMSIHYGHACEDFKRRCGEADFEDYGL